MRLPTQNQTPTVVLRAATTRRSLGGGVGPILCPSQGRALTKTWSDNLSARAAAMFAPAAKFVKKNYERLSVSGSASTMFGSDSFNPLEHLEVL